jgi:hypothetical protein
MLLVGSAALKRWYPSAREPFDLDILCTAYDADMFVKKLGSRASKVTQPRESKTVVQLDNGVMIELDYRPSAALFCQANEHRSSSQVRILGQLVMVAPPTTLYAIKRSHIYHANNWLKHIDDYHFLREQLTVPLSEDEKHAELVRRREHNKMWPKPKVNLLAPNEEFFTQYSINRKFEHDDVHKAVAFYGTPMYTRLKDDQSSAWCSWKKFQSLSHGDQIKTVQEEAFVIALERFIYRGERDGVKAFRMAVCLLATRMWAGKWAQYVVENYPEISRYTTDYVGLGMKLMDRDST